jgi:hypothetical protein
VSGEPVPGLVPPRPNPGPEPWPEPAPAPWLPAALLAVVVVGLLGAWGWWRRRRRRDRSRGGAASGPSPADRTPRERLVDLSVAVREALTARFGSSFRARTTEEVSADERLGPLLGEERFRELIRFLDRVDRIKFAPERPGDLDEDQAQALRTWEPIITAMTERIRAGPRRREGTESDGAGRRAVAIPRPPTSSSGDGRPPG